MKKIVLVLAMLTLAAPAWAAVTVEAEQTPDTNEVVISYIADANRPRAFALDISVSGPNVSISTPYDLNGEYYIYPGSISIVGGVVQIWGTPVAPGSKDANSMTLEMGSLYAPSDMNHPAPPPLFGVLCRFTVDGNACEENFFVTIEENAERGGVVMENPDEDPDLTLTGLDEMELLCIGCLCMGDLSGDGVIVNIEDFYMLLGALNKKFGETGKREIPFGDAAWKDCADMSGDGAMINIEDFYMLLGRLNYMFGQTGKREYSCPYP